MIIASFATEVGLGKAATDLLSRNVGRVETYLGMEPQNDQEGSVLPAAMLCGGLAGGTGGFLMQVWATTISYPLNIGGRPDFSWPSYVPATFELAVLGAVLTGFIGYFVLAGLPHLYDPVDESDRMRQPMQGGYVLVVYPSDRAAVWNTLSAHAPIGVEETEE
ncbi:DUF3341 domain-containing protein [Acetobacter fallax]|uniref:DUF3341 domain-containing protein n=1 Tax=Acetobacter fallax TaxID=1737473 RepID=A0ABX0KFL2_9PROT|nr:DUF3341 domain-containing protein [Acetobacter fallax]NHO33903.1 DUF3341 domain-containing protein [Acetobacter fallax]NHO37458.1 DUF3341 domain-containing protein [Acetobacter fallax]